MGGSGAGQCRSFPTAWHLQVCVGVGVGVRVPCLCFCAWITHYHGYK